MSAFRAPKSVLLSLMLLVCVPPKPSVADDKDWKGGIGALMQDDIVTVPSKTRTCALKALTCKNQDLKARYKEFTETSPTELRFWTQYRCHRVREELRLQCGEDAKIIMRYSGPWAAGPVRADGSWLIESRGNTGLTNLVAVLPIDMRKHHGCFQVKNLDQAEAERANSFEDAKPLNEAKFCVPAVDVVGYPKCATSALYALMTLHNETAKAAQAKEWCMTGYPGGIWEWIDRMVETAAKDDNKLIVNGCFRPDHIFNEEIFFRVFDRPNLKMMIVRNLPDRLWAAWNYWCDPLKENTCSGPQWANKENHFRSPEFYHGLLMESNKQGVEVFRNAPPPDELAQYYMLRYKPFNDLSPKPIPVVSKELLEINPERVWADLSTAVKELFGRELAPHTALDYFTKIVVNSGEHHGAQTKVEMGSIVEGVYSISDKQPLLNETRRYILDNWKECERISSMAGWKYPCVMQPAQ